MREDIVAGLKNAFERGESMEKAVQAFINAGYNKNEVEEAAKFLGFSYSQQEQSNPIPAQQIQQKSQFQPLPKSPSLAQETPMLNNPSLPASDNSEKTNSLGKFKIFNIILGIIVLLLILGVIGFFAWKFLNGEWILG